MAKMHNVDEAGRLENDGRRHGSKDSLKAQSSRSRLRCAIYTRKSTEEGLDQEFNSLDAQREACAAFIASQVGLGWKLVPDLYDDGGISGGTMERPALQRLLQDIRDQKVDVVVVYKIDRLTRSLADFARIVEVFDGAGASFVSVTQQFNTTTSMGRLTLNVLLSFAQFEREVTAERIRDKIAASRKKGMWMGGTVPLGYKVDKRKLVVNEPEASFVRSLFNRYLELKSVVKVAAEVSKMAAASRGSDPHSEGDGIREARGDTRYASRPMSPGMLCKLLANPLYIGKVRHRRNIHEGEHQALIGTELFLAVQKQLAAGAPVPRGSTARRDVHLLTGMLFDDTGDRMGPRSTTTRGKRYRYYFSNRIRRTNGATAETWLIPANQMERLVRNCATDILGDKARLATWIRDHASADHITTGLAAVDDLSAKLGNYHAADIQRSTLQLMFGSITLATSAIRFDVNVRSIVEHIVGADQMSSDESASIDYRAVEAIEVPVTLSRRGNGMRLVIDSTIAHYQEPDAGLVDLVARAHLYLGKLTSSSDTSITDVAKTYGVDRADVGRILPLAFLAPEMLKAILTGGQSSPASARQLARADLPMTWAEQTVASR
jgi:site-specific DNA recombinase